MAEMLYFTYGSNLLKHQMQARCPGARLHSVVRVEGYELCFPMISFTRSGMGVASIRPNEDAYVEGCHIRNDGGRLQTPRPLRKRGHQVPAGQDNDT